MKTIHQVLLVSLLVAQIVLILMLGLILIATQIPLVVLAGVICIFIAVRAFHHIT